MSLSASSVSMFQSMTNWFATRLPKTRGDYTIMIVLAVMAFGMGIAYGYLLGSGVLGV